MQTEPSRIPDIRGVPLNANRAAATAGILRRILGRTPGEVPASGFQSSI